MSDIHGYVLGNDPNASAQGMPPVPTESQNIPLSSCEWYFGNISREDAREKLLRARDGTFLVRDSTTGNFEYTLTLKKDGMDRVIKIYNNDGKFGFTKSDQGANFPSVPDLVSYYRNNSLKIYNNILDIKLQYPVSRFNQEDDLFFNYNNDLERLVKQYLENHKELIKMEAALENSYIDYKKAEDQLSYTRTGFDLYNDGELIWDEHQKKQIQMEKLAQPHEVASFKENMELSRSRFLAFLSCKEDLDTVRKDQQTLFLKYERAIQSLRLPLTALRRNEELYLDQLKRQGLKEDQIKYITEHGYKAWLNHESSKLPHLDEDTWFCPNYTRPEAEAALFDMPNGTFLIRARNPTSYALSITCNNVVNHCIISHTDTGFGFAEPFNIFESLLALVKHYAQNSLEEHNDLLQTALRYPVKCPYILSIKEHKKSSTGSDKGQPGDKNPPNNPSAPTAASAQNNLGIPYPAYAPK